MIIQGNVRRRAMQGALVCKASAASCAISVTAVYMGDKTESPVSTRVIADV